MAKKDDLEWYKQTMRRRYGMGTQTLIFLEQDPVSVRNTLAREIRHSRRLLRKVIDTERFKENLELARKTLDEAV